MRFDKLAAGLGHAQSLNMLVLHLHRAGLGLGSDLSWCGPRLCCICELAKRGLSLAKSTKDSRQ